MFFLDESFELLIQEMLKKRKSKTQKPAAQATQQQPATSKDSPSKKEEKGCEIQ